MLLIGQNIISFFGWFLIKMSSGGFSAGSSAAKILLIFNQPLLQPYGINHDADGLSCLA
jgi:hypothetical protein